MGGEVMSNDIQTLQLRGSDYGDIIIKDDLSADFAAKIIAQLKAKLSTTQTSTSTPQEQT
jgi:hypothetical protein